jgi:hypothetical protein
VYVEEFSFGLSIIFGVCRGHVTNSSPVVKEFAEQKIDFFEVTLPIYRQGSDQWSLAVSTHQVYSAGPGMVGLACHMLPKVVRPLIR